MVICTFIGAFLRLYLLKDQVLLDDEWHGLFYATAHPFLYLLRYVTLDANCAPLNAYAWALLHSVGWSELTLRLPSLIPGLLALVILPLLVRRIHGTIVASLFAVFFACSPFLTFYSRIFRPYSALVFFEFTAIYAAGIWLHTGKERYRLVYLLTSTAALYFHPVAVIGIMTPWAASFGLWLRSKVILNASRPPELQPDSHSIILTAALAAAVVVVTVQPGVVFEHISPQHSVTIETLKQSLLILFGTTNLAVASALMLLCLAGLGILLKQSIFWGTLFVTAALLHFLMIEIGNFWSLDVPIVLVRYLAILVPLSHVCTAIGLSFCVAALARLSTFQHPATRVSTLVMTILIGGYWMSTNPLKYAYAAPNNFTNHSAFIEQGRFGGWDLLYPSRFAPRFASFGPPQISAFYRNLPPRTRLLIEYPMLLGDHYNYYYFFQHHHRRRIIIGYTDKVAEMPPTRDWINPDFFVNHVARAAEDEGSIRFRNMVNILDAEAVRRTNADFLICHRDLLGEFLPKSEPHLSAPTPGIQECIEHSFKHYGIPVFDDENIIVFDLSKSPSSTFGQQQE